MQRSRLWTNGWLRSLRAGGTSGAWKRSQPSNAKTKGWRQRRDALPNAALVQHDRVFGEGKDAIMKANPMERRLAEVDPDIAQAIENEERRQHEGLELIASENFVSEAVLERSEEHTSELQSLR